MTGTSFADVIEKYNTAMTAAEESRKVSLTHRRAADAAFKEYESEAGRADLAAKNAQDIEEAFFKSISTSEHVDEGEPGVAKKQRSSEHTAISDEEGLLSDNDVSYCQRFGRLPPRPHTDVQSSQSSPAVMNNSAKKKLQVKRSQADTEGTITTRTSLTTLMSRMRR